MAKDKTLDHLAGIPLFSGLSRKDLQHLRGLCNEIEVPKGKVLCKQGSVGYECFVIVDGTASVEADGHVLTTLGAGAYFGELALLDKQPRSATVTALGPMTVLVLGPREFSAALAEVPGLAGKLLASMARRLREANSRLLAH